MNRAFLIGNGNYPFPNKETTTANKATASTKAAAINIVV
jgi:hypothetical protein